MKILGIETSCDETAAAIIEDGSKILSNIVASSAEIHAKTGGIIPEQAARQQIKSIIPVVEAAFVKAGFGPPKIDAIGVTVGPGLIGSLLVGLETAKTLALIWKKPIVPANHLAAHIYANWLETEKKPELPALALVVSGGHTDLVLMSDHGKLSWVGGTRDDAAGEVFDKTARLLGLSYPGGPAIAAEAEKYLAINPTPLTLLPRPMIEKENFDWSFSGLKTAVARKISTNEERVSKERLAAEIQEAIVDVLVKKSLRAINRFKPRSFLLAGGVAANQRLRQKFKKEIKNLPANQSVDFRVPPPELCTDNAAYVASFAYYHHLPITWSKIVADPQLTITGQL